MRVGLDVSAVSQRPAGAGRYIVELAKRIVDDGVTATLIATRGDAKRWETWSPQSQVVDVVPSPRPLRLIYEATVLGRRAGGDVDVWHGPHYTMPRTIKKPVVVTFCDMTFFTNPEWHEGAKVLFFRRAMRYASQHATELISISETTTRALRDCLNPKIPVTTIPLGVDHDRFSVSAGSVDLQQFGVPNDRPYIFFLGTFEPRKGLDVLLDAFREVGAKDRDVELWLAGQAGWHTTATEDVISQHPYASRIRRLGYVDDAAVPALMRNARVVAYPSRGEGFGLPVLEALACGAEVVTTAHTVMEEVAGTAATLTEAGHAGELADALLDAMRRTDNEREERSQRAVVQAAQFTWSATADAHRSVYQRLANR